MKKGIVVLLYYWIIGVSLLNAAAKEDAELLGELHETKLEHYELKNEAVITLAIKQISIRLEIEKDPELANRFKTIKIPDALKAKKIAKMGLGKVSVAEILDVISHRAGMSWKVKNGTVVLAVLAKKNQVSKRVKTLEMLMLITEFRKEVTLRQSLNYLRLRVRELAKPAKPFGNQPKRGVSFIVRDRGVQKSSEGLEDEVEETASIMDRNVGELIANHLTVVELMNLFCERCEAKWEILNDKIVITDLNKKKNK